jgi:hypothetical protein
MLGRGYILLGAWADVVKKHPIITFGPLRGFEL